MRCSTMRDENQHGTEDLPNESPARATLDLHVQPHLAGRLRTASAPAVVVGAPSGGAGVRAVRVVRANAQAEGVAWWPPAVVRAAPPPGVCPSSAQSAFDALPHLESSSPDAPAARPTQERRASAHRNPTSLKAPRAVFVGPTEVDRCATSELLLVSAPRASPVAATRWHARPARPGSRLGPAGASRSGAAAHARPGSPCPRPESYSRFPGELRSDAWPMSLRSPRPTP